MIKSTLVASLVKPDSLSEAEITALPESVDWLEVRADVVGDPDPLWLRNHFRGPLLYTLRSRAEGGLFEGSQTERHQRLLKAATEYDLIDLEGDRDLLPALLDKIPGHKRLVSWQGSATDFSELKAKFEQLSAVEGRLYKLVTRANQSYGGLLPLSLLNSSGRSDTIAYCSGPIGLWSRLIAARLGAPIIFGAVGSGREILGEPTLSRLIQDYGLPFLPPVEDIYGIVGNPVLHSLSPRLHNAAYRALGYSALFVSFHVESFGDFWREVVLSETLQDLRLSIKGLTVASPHKESAIELAEASSPMVRRAGATNVFVRKNGGWKADTTDPQGIIVAMRERGIALKDKKAAVVGCGGAGRAIAAALDQAGSSVTLVNRGIERGLKANELLGLPFIPLSDFSVESFYIVVNATPVGRDDNQMPFQLTGLSDDAVVVDLVYGSNTTPLIANTLASGRVAIDGKEVLLIQVLHQFNLMTGHEMPVRLAREILGWDAEAPTAASAR